MFAMLFQNRNLCSSRTAILTYLTTCHFSDVSIGIVDSSKVEMGLGEGSAGVELVSSTIYHCAQLQLNNVLHQHPRGPIRAQLCKQSN